MRRLFTGHPKALKGQRYENVVREESAAQSQGHTCSWQVPAELMASWEAEGPACLAKARRGECGGLNEASTKGQL